MSSALHRRILRRYSKLAIGAPNAFNCIGGFHQASFSMGDFPGDIVSGSVEEKILQPPRVDSRWPRHCDHCYYRFLESDRWHFYTEPVAAGE